MFDPYAAKRRRVAAKIREWKTGTVTLTRTTRGEPDADTPWIPGELTDAIYTIDARVNGVAAEYVNGETILASDLMVIASPRAIDENGAAVEIVPAMSDTLQIDGAAKVVKKIEAVPAAGAAACFHIFVAS